MLKSALIHLTATQPVLILGPLGRPIQAWFLGLLCQVDGKLAAEMHQPNGVRPYTVSTLLDDRGYPLRANYRMETGQSCWLRITTFRQDISDILTKKLLYALPERLEIYKMPFRMDECTFNRFQHPWAGETSWQEIVNPANPLERETERNIRMMFSSPTAFREQGTDLPLPLPGCVFRSLYERWNAFAPAGLVLDSSWPNFARECVVVDEMTSVNTQRWSFAEGTHGVATGFMGTVGFQLLAQRRTREWADQWNGAACVLQTLARFAFFAGVGHHTTIGMGQARLLI